MYDSIGSSITTSNYFSLSLQDPNYVLGDPVAANVAVMDKKDNYVSVVTSLNTWFGSKVSGECNVFFYKKNTYIFSKKSYIFS